MNQSSARYHSHPLEPFTGSGKSSLPKGFEDQGEILPMVIVVKGEFLAVLWLRDSLNFKSDFSPLSLP